MRRSSASERAACLLSVLPRTARRSFVAARSSRTIPCLATVPPGDRNSESDVEPAEAGSHKCVRPRGRREESDRADEHEAEAHYRDDANGKRAAGDDRGTI